VRGRYDLAFDFDPEIVRVQCKLAQRGKGVVRVGLQTNRCVPGGYVQTTYDRTEIDAVCAYSRELRRSFFIPAREACGRRGLHLRLAHPANNQRDGIKWADAYDFAAAIARLRAGCASGLSVSSQLH
jgi:hypothetical protein